MNDTHANQEATIMSPAEEGYNMSRRETPVLLGHACEPHLAVLAMLTVDHPVCRYGRPVLIDGDRVYAAADLALSAHTVFATSGTDTELLAMWHADIGRMAALLSQQDD